MFVKISSAAVLLALAIGNVHVNGQTVTSARLRQESRQLDFDYAKLSKRRVELLIRHEAIQRQSKNLDAALKSATTAGDRATVFRQMDEWSNRADELAFDSKRYLDDLADYNQRVRAHEERVRKYNQAMVNQPTRPVGDHTPKK